jgi:hypothetical protein
MKKTSFRLAAATLAAGLALPVFALEDAGTIKTVQGSVSVLRAGQKLAAAPGLKVQAADKLTTGADGSVGITLRDNTVLSAGPNSSLSLDKFAFNPTTHEGAIDASLKRGTLAVISGKIAKASPDAVNFRTNSVTLGVRGTEFIIEANGKDD